MTEEPPRLAKPPGFLWPILLGLVGFGTGFFGPLIFVPEANQGPLVGIFITGPGGFVLGLLVWGLMRLLALAARGQWQLLVLLAVAGTITTFGFVQPEPATCGYELEIVFERTYSPNEVADAVIGEWKDHIARVTWATPRSGWEAQMRAALAADPGRVLEGVVLRQRTIKEHRKPWNRGRLFATPWKRVEEKRRYYFGPDTPAPTLAQQPARMFIRSDSTQPIRAPDIWPPVELLQFIRYSHIEPVPIAYASLP